MALILVADDDPLVVRAITRFMEGVGHTVIPAFDGESAWLKYNMNRVDLVITDLYMPNGDGLQLIRNIKKSDKHTPIIAITGAEGDITDDLVAKELNCLNIYIMLKKPIKHTIVIAVELSLADFNTRHNTERRKCNMINYLKRTLYCMLHKCHKLTEEEKFLSRATSHQDLERLQKIWNNHVDNQNT